MPAVPSQARCIMRSWFRSLRRPLPSHPSSQHRHAYRPALENLEGRCLLSGGYLQTNLVSDISGLARTTDANLVNSWGIAFGPSGPLWVADNGSGVATEYNRAGTPFPPGPVTIPPPSSMPGATATPTGVVFNNTPGFVVSSAGMSGPAVFLFVTEDGTISGWNPNVDPKNAILAVDNAA